MARNKRTTTVLLHSKPSLVNLPVELLEQITPYLSKRSFKNLRLTHSSIAAKTTYQFSKRCLPRLNAEFTSPNMKRMKKLLNRPTYPPQLQVFAIQENSKRFRLSPLDAADLISVLRNHNATLQEVILDGIVLHPGQWRSLFAEVKTIDKKCVFQISTPQEYDDRRPKGYFLLCLLLKNKNLGNMAPSPGMQWVGYIGNVGMKHMWDTVRMLSVLPGTYFGEEDAFYLALEQVRMKLKDTGAIDNEDICDRV
ncbi:hypothetical protein EJ08DRAFT_652580 [Tothia fuscella]|uniref:F-box domain-containing protein n=1 Tax=Tothia fuscella TaxID=1048955 RepID=A0A9P4NJF9_9PEZI|nr:hypothetical protein EJ08DRAFT_652580 [Tothia fuscella]